MAKKGKGSNIPWTPIILVGGLVVAYTQRDKIMPMIDQLKGKIGMRSRAYVGFNALPYGYASKGQFYPYHQTHYSI